MDAEIQAQNGKSNEQRGKSERPRPIAVEVVRRDGKSVLCAWMDGNQYRRAFVPASKLKGNDVDAAVLEKCPAYGVDWAKKFNLPGADGLANELRRQGIWTADDFKRGAANVRAAIMRVYVNPLIEELIKEL